MKRRKVVETPRAEAPQFLAKGIQFVDEARSALAASRHDAALLNANTSPVAPRPLRRATGSSEPTGS